MKNIFNSIKVETPKSNTFDLTHDVKMSGRMGYLMPCLAMPCIPGDRVKLACDNLVRFAPLIAPVMHRMDVRVEYFFVPNRLLWQDWEKFITNQATGGLPQLTMSGAWSADQLKFADYLGVAPFDIAQGSTAVNINALPFAAYQKIYNDWYRPQDLVNDLYPPGTYPLTSGNNTGSLAVLAEMRRRSYKHDYFTAALPFAQRGNAVSVPIGEITLDPDWQTNGAQPNFQDAMNGALDGTFDQLGGKTRVIPNIGPPPSYDAAYDPDGSLVTTNTTITDLRRAFKLQAWLEKAARAGVRYRESILAFFGVRSSDQRLQRPEYITGTKSPIVVSEVLNTTGETGGLPQGNMAGHAVSVGDGRVGSYFCEEHGYIIGIVSVIPVPSYQQGIPREYLKTDPFDFFWPEFQHVGEQAIQNNEIYAYQPTGEDTFGYIPRYAEYKYMPNRVAGEFRTSLDFWHLGRIFGNLPTLSQQFLEVNDDEQDRIFAVTAGDDNLYIHILHKIQARRSMAVYGTPML